MQTINDLREQIMAKAKELLKGEGSLLLTVICLGRLFTSLRCSVRKNAWLKELEKMQYKERDVRRYLIIGDSWWSTPQAIGPDLLAKLPYDMHKLEWLCRLSRKELETLTEYRDLRTDSRGEVISRVKKILKVADDGSVRRSAPTIADIQKRFDTNVIHILDALDELPEDTTDEMRIELLEALMKSFKEIEDTLMSPESQPPVESARQVSPVGVNPQASPG